MTRQNISDLMVFLAVARERSFTKAAAKLGVSQSALSHTVRQLEARIGVRLLTRTTRAVSPTEAGQRLIDGIGARFDEIEAEVDSLNDLIESPRGTIRITAPDHALSYILWPKIKEFCFHYPDINIELLMYNGLLDIVMEQLDAGVRLGEQVAKDMISVRISPDVRFAVVAAPDYFEKHPKPQRPQDLVAHRCINLRFASGGFWAWEFQDGDHEVKIRVEGQLAFNNVTNMLDAVMSGLGIAYLPEDMTLSLIESGHLTRVLHDYCPAWEGFFLYYPSRRQSALAFQLLVDAIRHRT